MAIIGISGKKSSGKDTAYLLISRELPAFRFAFADAVKDYAARYFNVDRDAVGDAKEKTRFILQGVGEMFRNEVSKTYWIDRVFSEIEALDDDGYLYVITDVRYKNEVDSILERGGKVFRVVRTTANIEEDHHPSETELTDADFSQENIIYNDGGLEDFQIHIQEWLEREIKCIR